MQAWAGFYTVTAGVAATLMGLLFVTVSINGAVILGARHHHSRRLAEQAFQNYVTVLTVSLLTLFPGLSNALFGRIALSVTAVSGAWVVIRSYLALTGPQEDGMRMHPLRRQFLSLVGFAILLFAAVEMAFGLDDSRNWLAAAIMVLLASATAVSWQLLLQMADAKS
jgi:hypothetical protein